MSIHASSVIAQNFPSFSPRFFKFFSEFRHNFIIVPKSDLSTPSFLIIGSNFLYHLHFFQ